MNRAVIVVALILACIFTCNGINPELKAVVDECKSQHNIESGQIKEAIDNKKLPETENEKCFVSCIMEKLGVLKHGKVDLDRMMELHKKKFTNPESLEKADEVARRCASVEYTNSEECSMANELLACAFKNAAELKLEMDGF